MKSSSRSRHSAEYWQKIIAEFQQSELSGAKFCKLHNIAYASFCQWRQKLNHSSSEKMNTATHTFINLDAIASTKIGWNIVLKLGDDVELMLSRT